MCAFWFHLDQAYNEEYRRIRSRGADLAIERDKRSKRRWKRAWNVKYINNKEETRKFGYSLVVPPISPAKQKKYIFRFHIFFLINSGWFILDPHNKNLKVNFLWFLQPRLSQRYKWVDFFYLIFTVRCSSYRIFINRGWRRNYKKDVAPLPITLLWDFRRGLLPKSMWLLSS